MWKRTQQSYGTSDAPVTPYQRAAQAWDDRIGSARVQAQSWRLAALTSLGLSFVLAGGLVWQSTQSLVTPYVVELSQDGAVRAIAPATETYQPTDAQIAYHLAAFIGKTRGVSIDPVVMRQNWLEAYDFATDRAAATLNAFAREKDPFAEIGRRMVSVEVTSIVRASEDTFTVRWNETEYREGTAIQRAEWTASLSLIIDPPRDAETLRKNPLGLYIHAINWSKDLHAERPRP